LAAVEAFMCEKLVWANDYITSKLAKISGLAKNFGTGANLGTGKIWRLAQKFTKGEKIRDLTFTKDDYHERS